METLNRDEPIVKPKVHPFVVSFQLARQGLEFASAWPEPPKEALDRAVDAHEAALEGRPTPVLLDDGPRPPIETLSATAILVIKGLERDQHWEPNDVQAKKAKRFYTANSFHFDAAIRELEARDLIYYDRRREMLSLKVEHKVAIYEVLRQNP